MADSFHPLALEANEAIGQTHAALLTAFSARGKSVYFPRTGILGQSAEAKNAKLNATIGIALNDDGSPMHLPLFDELVNLDPKDVYPYASSYGKEELRQIWKNMLSEKNPSLKSMTTTPVVCAGLTHALAVAGLLFADPGDEIILPDRFWDNYTLLFEHLCGAALKTYATFKGNAFDTKSFRTALLARTGKRIILFNFPNNPSGYSPTAKEVQEIVDAIRASAKQGSTVIVILDDAYFGLVYEQGVERESLLSYLADLHERVLVVKIDGATKEDFVWGHRVAFITFAVKGMSEKCAKALEAKAAGTVRETTSNAPHLSQSLLLKLYASPEYREQKKHAATVLERRYLAVCDAVKGGKYDECFRALPFNSGYFMCVELAKGLDAETVRRRLLEKYGTGVIALGNLLRVAYSSLPEDSIGEVFSNIAAACRELSLSPS